MRGDTEQQDGGRLGKAVHSVTREKTCADGGHLAASVDFRPECVHELEPDTAYTLTGLKADLRRDFDYPVEAQCRHYKEWIRKEQYAVTGPGAKWRLKNPKRMAER